jgi:hypothetical protein
MHGAAFTGCRRRTFGRLWSLIHVSFGLCGLQCLRIFQFLLIIVGWHGRWNAP